MHGPFGNKLIEKFNKAFDKSYDRNIVSTAVRALSSTVFSEEIVRIPAEIKSKAKDSRILLEWSINNNGVNMVTSKSEARQDSVYVSQDSRKKAKKSIIAFAKTKRASKIGKCTKYRVKDKKPIVRSKVLKVFEVLYYAYLPRIEYGLKGRANKFLVKGEIVRVMYRVIASESGKQLNCKYFGHFVEQSIEEGNFQYANDGVNKIIEKCKAQYPEIFKNDFIIVNSME